MLWHLSRARTFGVSDSSQMVECLILGHDPSVRAGAFNQFNSKKLMRGLEIARENRLPYVQFVESAGADLRGEGGGDPEAAIGSWEWRQVESVDRPWGSP